MLQCGSCGAQELWGNLDNAYVVCAMKPDRAANRNGRKISGMKKTIAGPEGSSVALRAAWGC